MLSVGPCDDGAGVCPVLGTTQPSAVQSVIELRKGSGRKNFQPVELQSAGLSSSPPSAVNPSFPLPDCAMTYCHGKNYLLLPVVGLLQISCSVCGPGLFLCSEAWIPHLAKVLLHSATARRSEAQTAHHWTLLLSSVPFASDIFIFPMEWPTWFTPSLRGGMRSLMRSRPLASSKLVILCWGENPRMAERRKQTKGLGEKYSWCHLVWCIIPRYQLVLAFCQEV